MLPGMTVCGSSSGADFMEPEELDPPPIFEPWGSCSISAPQ